MQKKYYRQALLIKILIIIGLIISLPFILVFGLGLVTFAPLLFLFLWNRKLSRAIKTNSPLGSRDYRLYIIGTLLAGAGSSFGFYVLWVLSQGIDVPTPAFTPFLLMVLGGCPLITAWIILFVRSWQRVSAKLTTIQT